MSAISGRSNYWRRRHRPGVARALALRGVRDVLLIERSSLGAEASSAAAGMLAPQAEANRAHEFFYLTCRSRDMYPEFAAALLEETGIDIELDTTGTLYLAFTEHDAEELEKRYEWQTRAPDCRWRNSARQKSRRLEPSINEDVRVGSEVSFRYAGGKSSLDKRARCLQTPSSVFGWKSEPR